MCIYYISYAYCRTLSSCINVVVAPMYTYVLKYLPSLVMYFSFFSFLWSSATGVSTRLVFQEGATRGFPRYFYFLTHFFAGREEDSPRFGPFAPPFLTCAYTSAHMHRAPSHLLLEFAWIFVWRGAPHMPRTSTHPCLLVFACAPNRPVLLPSPCSPRFACPIVRPGLPAQRV